MHMADALISPAVGGTIWAVSLGIAAYSAKKVQYDLDEKKVPMMGILGAFIFASQMINFTIPGTGSSGHLGGGLILAILLGPYAGFIVMASVLIIQALFFGDGGLLALGCNIFNLGFFSCFIGYNLIFKLLTKDNLTQARIFWGSVLAAIIGLQLGALSVVLQTFFSGISSLPFSTFLLLMQPIHLVIGIVEGLVTATVVSFVYKARPEILKRTIENKSYGNIKIKNIIIAFIVSTVIVGSILSWFASTNPDGLEWSIFKTSGKEELVNNGKIYESLAEIQEKTAILPDYSLKKTETDGEEIIDSKTVLGNNKQTKVENKVSSIDKKTSRTGINAGTSIAGIAGAIFTLLFAGLLGLILNKLKKRKK